MIITTIVIEIIKMSRKIKTLQFNIIVLIILERRFQILFQFLNNQYNVFIDVINVQNKFNIKKFI